MMNRWLARTFGKKCVLAASILSLSVQLMPAAPSFAFLKSANTMQMPINEKLDMPAADASAAAPAAQPAAPPDLSPMRLDDPPAASAQQSGGVSGADPTDNNPGVLKVQVSTTDYVPKGPADKGGMTVAPMSIKNDKTDDVSDKVLRNAKDVGVMPLALMASPDEEKAKTETAAEAEKAELTDLWDAALTRSPDIQFVTQKLMPTSSTGMTTHVLTKFLTAAMFGAMGAVNMVSPNMGTYAATGSGSNMIAQVLGMADQNAAKKAKLSQTEAIMLYNIVRTTADHLVENYRNYKKVTTNLRTANADLTDLQSMVKDAKSKDNAQSIEMEYTLRKAQRDIDSINEDVKKYRQGLADLAGAEAIDKLDKQLQEEQDRLDPGAQVADKAPEKSTLNPSDTKSGDPRSILATDKNSTAGSNDKKISAAPVKPPM
jgi:hypothetical protein